MKSLQHDFATITAAIEDLHSIAVEGQAHDATPDMHEALAACLREQLGQIDDRVAYVMQRLRGRLK